MWTHSVDAGSTATLEGFFVGDPSANPLFLTEDPSGVPRDVTPNLPRNSDEPDNLSGARVPEDTTTVRDGGQGNAYKDKRELMVCGSSLNSSPLLRIFSKKLPREDLLRDSRSLLFGMSDNRFIFSSEEEKFNILPERRGELLHSDYNVLLEIAVVGKFVRDFYSEFTEENWIPACSTVRGRLFEGIREYLENSFEDISCKKFTSLLEFYRETREFRNAVIQVHHLIYTGGSRTNKEEKSVDDIKLVEGLSKLATNHERIFPIFIACLYELFRSYFAAISVVHSNGSFSEGIIAALVPESMLVLTDLEVAFRASPRIYNMISGDMHLEFTTASAKKRISDYLRDRNDHLDMVLASRPKEVLSRIYIDDGDLEVRRGVEEENKAVFRLMKIDGVGSFARGHNFSVSMITRCVKEKISDLLLLSRFCLDHVFRLPTFLRCISYFPLLLNCDLDSFFDIISHTHKSSGTLVMEDSLLEGHVSEEERHIILRTCRVLMDLNGPSVEVSFPWPISLIINHKLTTRYSCVIRTLLSIHVEKKQQTEKDGKRRQQNPSANSRMYIDTHIKLRMLNALWEYILLLQELHYKEFISGLDEEISDGCSYIAYWSNRYTQMLESLMYCLRMDESNKPFASIGHFLKFIKEMQFPDIEGTRNIFAGILDEFSVRNERCNPSIRSVSEAFLENCKAILE